MVHSIDWKDTTPGDNPVCLVGAGFQIAALDKQMPSTKTIIKETVQNKGKHFPILSALCNSKISLRLDLNYIWKNTGPLSLALANYSPQIRKDYSSLNNKITDVINWYQGLPIKVVFELELKKMIAYHYDFQKFGHFNGSVIDNMRRIISQNIKFTWISLNYDVILEKMLVCVIYGKEEFNFDFRKVKYAFEPLLTNKSSTNDDSEHILIKPHGSLNVVFETDNQNTYNKIHKIYYKDKNNYFDTFNWDDMGYNRHQNKINEKRPWMIGYLPDDLKEELNSKAYFSDLAHDLCKWNMAYSSFALGNATSLFILGYSMPDEDEWIWTRVRNIEDKEEIEIYIASDKDSEKISESFENIGFRNVHIVNKGKIDG
jgi:hypothetical protein